MVYGLRIITIGACETTDSKRGEAKVQEKGHNRKLVTYTMSVNDVENAPIGVHSGMIWLNTMMSDLIKW